MSNGYNPKSFWNERFIKHGHTGEVDALLYAYDQPQRLRAIHQALSRVKTTIDTNTMILDFGCGTGDLISSLMKYGDPEITGIDISEATINYTRERFSDSMNIRLFTMGVEDMEFPSNSFDLAVGVNVLQHIVGDSIFFKAIENLVRVIKEGGHLLIMDFSPIKVVNRLPAPYVIIRSRQEYISAFEERGCKFISEFGLPRIGVRLYRVTNKVLGRIRRLSNSQAVMANSTWMSRKLPSLKFRIVHVLRVLLLNLTRLFDYWLMPFPARFADMRILIFEKALR